MYSRDEAARNHCEYAGDPMLNLLILIGVGVIFILFAPIFLALIFPVLISESLHYILCVLFPWFVVCVAIYYFLLKLEMKKGAQHTAFIKDEDTLWAVKLVYMPVVKKTHPTEPEYASWEDNQKLEKELEERSLHPESYEKALIDAQGKTMIMADLSKNFRFVFNGSEAVTRLDDIKFIQETDQTEIYSYKNYKGKVTKLEVAKAYPGLREEVLHTFSVNHKFSFPKDYKKHLNAFNAFNIFISSIFWFPLLCWLIGFIIDKIKFLSS